MTTSTYNEDDYYCYWEESFDDSYFVQCKKHRDLDTEFCCGGVRCEHNELLDACAASLGRYEVE